MAADNLTNSIHTIFGKSDEAIKQALVSHGKNKSVPIKDLELALTVLLVELASCDEKFEPQEYNVLQTGLRRMFGTTKDQVQALVNQATLVLKTLRGTSRFAELLKQHLDQPQREAILDIIEEIISADGKEDGFEIYIRNKVAGVLGLPTRLPPPKEDQ